MVFSADVTELYTDKFIVTAEIMQPYMFRVNAVKFRSRYLFYWR